MKGPGAEEGCFTRQIRGSHLEQRAGRGRWLVEMDYLGIDLSCTYQRKTVIGISH